MLEVLRYQREDGTVPITDWLRSLRDKRAEAKARIRVRRLEAGIFGDCKPVGDGVLELREHIGAGYRIYCARYGHTVVILLCGGTKKTRAKDIATARRNWSDWKARQP